MTKNASNLLLLKLANKTFKHLAVDVVNKQLTYLKIYLTLFLIFIATCVAAISFLNYSKTDNAWLVLEPFFMLTAFVLSTISFGLCIKWLTSKPMSIPFGNIQNNYEWIKLRESDGDVTTSYTVMLDMLTESSVNAVSFYVEHINDKARDLKDLNMLSLLTFGCIVSSLLVGVLGRM